MPRHEHHGRSFGLGAFTAGGIIALLTGGYKICELLIQMRKLHDVGEENAVFVRIIERVHLDLAEVERLLALPEVKFALSKNADKVEWIDRTMKAMHFALKEKARHTASVKKDVEKHRLFGVGLRKRVWWVLEEYDKLVNRRMEVSMCHQGVLEVLSFLAPMEPMACCDEAAEQAQKQKQQQQQMQQTQQMDQRRIDERRPFVTDNRNARGVRFESEVHVDRYEEPQPPRRSEETYVDYERYERENPREYVHRNTLRNGNGRDHSHYSVRPEEDYGNYYYDGRGPQERPRFGNPGPAEV